jgi:hypothetical protein
MGTARQVEATRACVCDAEVVNWSSCTRYIEENPVKQTDTRYVFSREDFLFGCNRGWIPRLLIESLAPSAMEPLKWSIQVGAALEQAGYPGHALMIDLKPNSQEPNLSLYEIVRVWGHSHHGWTPVMLYLRGLLIDEQPAHFDRQDFRRAEADIDDPVFSMMYLNGTVRGGKLNGKWTPPGPSPTNSVLLWPETLQYFSDEAAKLIR